MDHSEAHDGTTPYQNDEEIFYRTLPKTTRISSNKLVTATDLRQGQENRFVQARVQVNQHTHNHQTRQSSRRASRVTTTTPRPTTKAPPPPPPPVHHTAGEQEEQATFVPSEVHYINKIIS